MKTIFINREVPRGQGRIFELKHVPAEDSECVFRNGVLQEPPEEYVIIQNQIKLGTHLSPAEKLRVNYIVHLED